MCMFLKRETSGLICGTNRCEVQTNKRETSVHPHVIKYSICSNVEYVRCTHVSSEHIWTSVVSVHETWISDAVGDWMISFTRTFYNSREVGGWELVLWLHRIVQFHPPTHFWNFQSFNFSFLSPAGGWWMSMQIKKNGVNNHMGKCNLAHNTWADRSIASPICEWKKSGECLTFRCQCVLQFSDLQCGFFFGERRTAYSDAYKDMHVLMFHLYVYVFIYTYM